MSWQIVVLTVPLVVQEQFYLHVMVGSCVDSAASCSGTVILTYMAGSCVDSPLVVQVQLYLHVMIGSCVDSDTSCAGTVILTFQGRLLC